MKKFIALTLSAVMVLSFAACNKKAEETAEETEKETQTEVETETTTEQTENNAGIANPWIEVSANDIENYTGFRFGVPEGASDVKYFWCESEGIAEMQFSISSIDYVARVKETGALEDISGLYYDFASNPDNYGHGPDVFIWNNDRELRGEWHVLMVDNEMTANLGLWYYEGSDASYTWCLSSVNHDGVIDLSTPASEIFILGEANEDPVEYTQEYWANQYPDANICPFYINVNGEDIPYYWISSLVAEDSIASWAETPMNWNGWHMVDDRLVDADERFAITEDSMNMSFSSFCVYETEPFDSSAAGNSDESSLPSTTYNFQGYTETADWPDADAWAGLGLPELTMSDDVNGSVHISDSDWIYPLNGSDGVMFEAWPQTSQIDAIVADLQNAGIEVTVDDSYENGYTGYYTFNGNQMMITVSETGSGKITILVITNPT